MAKLPKKTPEKIRKLLKDRKTYATAAAILLVGFLQEYTSVEVPPFVWYALNALGLSFLRAAVKPIPSVSAPQRTVNNKNQEVTLQLGGRHDVSAIPRIVPVLKAMTLLVLADMWLLHTSRAGA